MRRPTLGISLEGVPYMGMACLVTLVFALLEWGLLSVLALIVTLGIVHFFRDPERVGPQDEKAALSPADGRVLEVRSRPDPETQEPRPRISIFMNVFNVHVNRTPVRGRVRNITYHQGRFLRASQNKADKSNERNVIRIEDEQGQIWSMVQIAGLIARRIVCWAEVDDQLEMGQRVGLIKFGSRVDLYLPEGYEIKVRPDDRVYAGQSILARKQE
ncbi:MAG: phosphatidylserine decarboxylase family protein [Desulfovermiculus sp.]|nr:phosphatidylserine decarboxylase family protein [Desulfovermiculus sp.]